MSATPSTTIAVEGWETRKLPPQLTCRFTFNSYAQTRQFLDDLADLSESNGNYPNLHFAKDFVTVTIAAPDDGALNEAEAAFARQVNSLANRILQG
ncbi:4a-hydroxytetrahydrobiopterin dehydratase [Halothiobacillus sp. DCM-1]|uniref:4a-hydroxytetrahydrobiopterin dehydratase n=1 Tax=Halothiobacillus sp. DCM-1 TaxID=3112558 RepID=UPI00324B56BC